jgi:hypothetical protein
MVQKYWRSQAGFIPPQPATSRELPPPGRFFCFFRSPVTGFLSENERRRYRANLELPC